jgi:O-antigen biosynthesis protein
MKSTGERMIPEFDKGQYIYLEHMTRYLFACQFVKNKIVLDIACGSGYGSKELFEARAKKVVGVDISEESIEYCKKNYQDDAIEFLMGGVDKIPLKDDSVDVIVSFETIEHVDEKAQGEFLKEGRRVLKDNGILVISTPNSNFYQPGNKFHKKELNEKEFEDILKKYFTNVEFYHQSDEAGRSIYIVAVCSDGRNFPKEWGATFFSKINIASFIDQKNEEVNIFRKTIQKKDLEVSNVKQMINKKDWEIFDLNQLVQEKNLEIKRKEQEINFVKSSKFWKIRKKYIKIKNKILKIIGKQK